VRECLLLAACCVLPLAVDRPRGHVPRQRVVDPLLVWIALLDRWRVTARQAERRRGKYMVLVYNETRSAAAGGLSSDGSTSERAAGVDRPTAEVKMRAHTIPYPESCYCYVAHAVTSLRGRGRVGLHVAKFGPN
jgi:hypothetical protein